MKNSLSLNAGIKEDLQDAARCCLKIQSQGLQRTRDLADIDQRGLVDFYLKVIGTKNGSSQGHNLALTVLYVPYSLDDDRY
jgi:hypothetical protein